MGKKLAEDIHRLLVELFLSTKEHESGCNERLGLKGSHARVLFRLEPRERVTVGALAERTRLDASNTSTAVAELEVDGLIDRRPADHDRRVRTVGLTPAGTELRKRLVDCLFSDAPSIRGLTQAQQAQLRDLLRRSQSSI
jgi:DNA-binding MarR family transcriptional regulator